MDTRTSILATVFCSLMAMHHSAHADSGAISGVSNHTYVKQDTSPIMHADGHVLMKAETQGTLKSNSPMNGAKVTNQEVAQLYMGNGTHQGFYTVSHADGSTVTRWSGNVTTVMKDNVPMTSFKGKWEYIQGTGKYAGIKGSGDYTGYFTSPTEYVVDWKGRYSL